MIRQVRLHPDASTDVRDAAEWYDKKAPGLGRLLLMELHRVLHRIRRFPQAYPQFKAGVRHATLSRFPYHAFYIESDESIVLLAVMHIRRDRRSVQEQLADRLER